MKPRTLRHMNWKSVTGSQLDSGMWLAPIVAGSSGEPGEASTPPRPLMSPSAEATKS